MAEAAYVLGATVQTSEVLDSPRHSALVRITHWIFTLSFFGLVVSGVGIILAHPHFYWGETGSIGTPSLFDLPLPTMLGGPSGWGRSLHFQSAWFAVLSGLLYAISGLFTQHFRNPGARAGILLLLTLGLAFMESLSLFTLVIIFVKVQY